MRIGWSLPLPGPFRVSGTIWNGSRRRPAPKAKPVATRPAPQYPPTALGAERRGIAQAMLDRYEWNEDDALWLVYLANATWWHGYNRAYDVAREMGLPFTHADVQAMFFRDVRGIGAEKMLDRLLGKIAR